jgi:8-oxo-dGTP pyrophosphatase MutT (NUDIX family)
VTDDAGRRADLRAELGRLEPIDAEAAADRDAAVRLLAEPEALHRHHHVPGHVTASAIVLHPDREAMALILHDALGMWLQPGGHIEPGDDGVVAAARREVAEETGLTGVIVTGGAFHVDGHTIPVRGDEPAHDHYDVQYLFVARTTRLVAGSGVRAARWTPFTTVAEATPDVSVRRVAAVLAGRTATATG